MGGSGGGKGSSFGNLEAFRKRTKEELDKAQGRRNVFISFNADDTDEVNLLRGQSANDLSDVEFNDWSVKDPYESANADYIKGKITDRIQQSSLTIVYITGRTAASKWVNWEIRKSLELGKQVVAVHKGNAVPSPLPNAIKENRAQIQIIPWSNLADFLKRL